MKSNELRIGNWVNSNGEDHQENALIASICREEVGFKSGDYGLIETIDGIPLKEDWLLKHGFFVENFDYSIPISDCKVVWLTLIPQDEECTAYSVCVTQTDEDEDDQNVFLSDISYVHQVQNLYFALTGNELKYEEQS